MAYDETGNQRAIHQEEHKTISHRPYQAEQDPEEILANVKKNLSLVMKQVGKVEAVTFASVLHTLVGFDEEGEPLTSLYTWADTRGDEYTNLIVDSIPDFHSRTGCVIHPMYPAVKLLWLREEKPDTFQSVPYWGSIKSFVLTNLTAEGVIEDQGIASGSGLLNTDLSWDDKILDLLDLPKKQLPRLVSTTAEIQGKSDIPQLKDVPIYPGAGDGMLAHLATAGLEKNQLSSTIGTSGALRISSPKPLKDREGKVWSYHLFPEVWIGGGAINNGGLALKWFLENIGIAAEEGKSRDPYETIDELVKETEPGASGLIFVPFLTGERSPEWRSYMKGGFFGLTLSHGKKEMLRAIMEGVMYRLKAVKEILTPYLPEEILIRASGGYSKSEPWLQIQADLFNTKIEVPVQEEATAKGAAILAMREKGVLEDIPEPQIREVYTPVPEKVRLYESSYEDHMDLYKHLVNYYQGK